MKMKKLAAAVLSATTLMAVHGLANGAIVIKPTNGPNTASMKDVGHGALPITSVADVDGDGSVTSKDADIVRSYVKKGKYVSLYDVNADGKLNGEDIGLTSQQLGETSTLLDQEMVAFYKRFEHLQGMNAEELSTFSYDLVFTALRGHGTHWLNAPSFNAMVPGGKPDYNKVEGLNIPDDGSEIKALFYGQGAIPVFMSVAPEVFFAAVDAGEDWTSLVTASDFPYGNAWKDLRVAAFYEGAGPNDTEHPPVAFQGAPTMQQAMMEGTDMRLAEMWHTHAGLCMTVGLVDGAPTPLISQHTTFNECQSKDNLAPQVIGQNPDTGELIEGNPWFNIWMMHLWFFDLNPTGVFSGVHPDVDPCGEHEESINDGKRVPPYFHMSDNDHEDNCSTD